MGQTDATTKDSRSLPALRVTLGSILLAALKGAGAASTGSAALLASAIDSAGDALVSAGNWLVVRAADQPADREHPFGHGKLEHLAGLGQGLIIGTSGVLVIREAVVRFGTTADLGRPLVGLGVTLFSLGAAWGFARYLKTQAKRHDSPALEADSLHYATDLFTHVGVLVVFASNLLFGSSPWLDPAVGVIIGAMILHGAWGLLIESGHRLMDAELEREELGVVEEVFRSFGPPVRGFHDLLTRRSGPDRFIQAHVEIDADVSFREAHEVIDRIESMIRARLPRAQIILHADPWPEDPGDPHQPHARASHRADGET